MLPAPLRPYVPLTRVMQYVFVLFIFFFFGVMGSALMSAWTSTLCVYIWIVSCKRPTKQANEYVRMYMYLRRTQHTSNETESGLILLMVKLFISSLCDPIIPLSSVSWVCKRQSSAKCGWICHTLHYTHTLRTIPLIRSIHSQFAHFAQLTIKRNNLQWDMIHISKMDKKNGNEIIVKIQIEMGI